MKSIAAPRRPGLQSKSQMWSRSCGQIS